MMWPFSKRTATGQVRKQPVARKMWRMWDAAKNSRLMYGWLQSSQPVNAEIRAGLNILRARSREQVQNNDYMARFIQMAQTNVVGHQGIILQSRAKDPDGTPDTAARNELESAWRDWGRFGFCEDTGRYSWRMIQSQFIRSSAVDGEVFLYMDSESMLNKYGFSVRFFDPDWVDTQLNRDLPDGSKIVMGVHLNSNDRPIGFYIKDARGSDFTYHGRNYRRIDADQVLHCFLPEWIFGVRGVPWCSQSLLRMGMLAGYEEAELVAARVASAKMGFFEQSEGGEYVGDAVDDNGDLITEADPGTFEALPQGVKYVAHDPQHPTTAYSEFVKASLRGIASGLGVSYNTLANDLQGVNYSSLRQGAIDERGNWMAIQEWMIECFTDRVYRAWLAASLHRGAITVANRPLRPDRFEKFADVAWQARRWQWVDPQKEIAAHEKAINLGIKSRSDVIREQGRDPEDVWLEIQREQSRMRELDILNDTVTVGDSGNE